jgi:hypothetical protein
MLTTPNHSIVMGTMGWVLPHICHIGLGQVVAVL